MPNVTLAIDTHPVTGVPGIWLDTGAGIVGLAKSAFPANPGGPAGTRQQRWQDAINAALATVGETTETLQAGDPRLTAPEPFCRVSGLNYIRRPFVITVTIITMVPLVVEWKISNGTDDVSRL
jgi:hypothetical protein